MLLKYYIKKTRVDCSVFSSLRDLYLHTEGPGQGYPQIMPLQRRSETSKIRRFKGGLVFDFCINNWIVDVYKLYCENRLSP